MEEKIRTRIAPSPTGLLHMGTARAALMNYLFAKKNNGKFILRIEDTDLERSNVEFEKDIIDGLRWLGILWDEGVGVGGDYAPYRQSERTNIYKKYIKRLLDEGKAYHCFCTEKELDLHRQAMMAEGEAPVYSGKCLSLSEDEVKNKIKNGEKSIIRFKVPKEKVSFNDLIKGKIDFNTELLGDIAVAKDENTPLYNLAVVVDDYEMNINYVIRGEDHISNTPKQIVIMEALGFKRPKYAHLPLVLGPDKRKLSKREGAVSVIDYKNEGYLPEAFLNFLVLLGWNSKTDKEVFSLSELEKEFKLENVQKSGAIFNIQKLDWFNAYYIKQKNIKELTELCLFYLKKDGLIEEMEDGFFLVKKTSEIVSFEYLSKLISLEKNRMKKLSEVSFNIAFFLEEVLIDNPDILIWKKSDKERTKNIILKIIDNLSSLDESEFLDGKIKESLSLLLKEYGNGDVFWPLRVALSGRKASPGPTEIAEILGKKKTIKRLKYAFEKIQ